MNLGQRLVLGALAVVSVLVLALAAIAGDRLRERLTESTLRDLEREARLAAASWTSRADPDSLADAMSALLGVQVTLIDSAGRVVGDSEFDGPALLALPPAKASPEVGAARRGETGRARETGSLAVAIRSGPGVVRAAVDPRRVEEVANGARRDIVFAGSIAAIVAMLLALAFARSISRPVVELNAVARAISAGDLARRPTLAAPGEVGELAAALHRMAELLANRLAALERDDALTTALLES
ncbi:MAG TPA: HAMP domain-containing protein, partial [Gemmatimonadaceae bacterium]|nr:HAMP domain-containing protein [Gemmatimonadaceae bacterium]